jgi:uncharacterized protein
MTARFEPRFLTVDPEPLGQRFAIHHPPSADITRGLVVYIHPFAEEMNKSRRMAAQQSRALAAAGFAVLQIDLLGCGDSAGDFGDATWAHWVHDTVCAVRWLRQRHPGAEGLAPPAQWLWGLRAGCLVAVDAAGQLAAEGERCDFLFWQPASAGKLLLQQFLRLKAASELLGGQAKAAMEELRGELAAGRRVEIAGYTLDAALCNGLEQAALRPPAMQPGRALWLEVSAVDSPTLAPAGAATLAAWRQASWTVDTQALRGPAFWQTTEIEDAPALLQATLAAMTAATPAASPAGRAIAPATEVAAA